MHSALRTSIKAAASRGSVSVSLAVAEISVQGKRERKKKRGEMVGLRWDEGGALECLLVTKLVELV
jgi:hypothetical protein